MEPPIVLRLAPELRRAAWYWLVALGVAACVSRLALGYGAVYWSPDLAPVSWWVPALLAAIALLAVFPYRWALRVDEQGLARRWVWGWDFWAWREIAAGRIRKGPVFVLVDRSRPWWRRRLALHGLAKADRDGIVQRVETLCGLGDPAERVPRVEAALASGGQSLSLEPAGLCVAHDHRRHTYDWSEVRRVLILRGEPSWGDYAALWIVLPDREVELAPHPESATVAEWIASRVPANWVATLSAGQRPARRDDAARLLARHDRQRVLRRVALLLSPIMATCCFLVGLVLVRGVRRASEIEAPVYLALIVAVVLWHSAWEHGQKRRQLRTWIEESPPEA